MHPLLLAVWNLGHWQVGCRRAPTIVPVSVLQGQQKENRYNLTRSAPHPYPLDVSLPSSCGLLLFSSSLIFHAFSCALWKHVLMNVRGWFFIVCSYNSSSFPESPRLDVRVQHNHNLQPAQYHEVFVLQRKHLLSDFIGYTCIGLPVQLSNIFLASSVAVPVRIRWACLVGVL